VRLLCCIVVVVAAACSSHNVRGNALTIQRDTVDASPESTVVSTGPVTVGDFEYRASNRGLDSRWSPLKVQVAVTIKNVSAHPATLDYLGGNCAVRLRVYSAEEVARAKSQNGAVRPTFDAAQTGYECYVPVVHEKFSAGEATTLLSGGEGPGVRLRSGRYRLTAVVTVVPSPDSLRRHGPNLIEVPAGSIRIPLPYD
jgi:hypothetical protein